MSNSTSVTREEETEVVAADITADERHELKDCACRINSIVRAIGHKLIELGGPATRAHEILATKRDGQFEAWVDENCEVSLSYVYGAIRVYKNYRHLDFETVSKMDSKALLLLSSNTTPDEARQEAAQRAEVGEHITHKVAKEIVEKRKPERKRAVAIKPAISDSEGPESPDAEEPADHEPESKPKARRKPVQAAAISAALDDIKASIEAARKLVQASGETVLINGEPQPLDPNMHLNRFTRMCKILEYSRREFTG